MIFEFYEQKYVEKVYLKLKKSTKQESPEDCFKEKGISEDCLDSYLFFYALIDIFLLMSVYFHLLFIYPTPHFFPEAISNLVGLTAYRHIVLLYFILMYFFP